LRCRFPPAGKGWPIHRAGLKILGPVLNRDAPCAAAILPAGRDPGWPSRAVNALGRDPGPEGGRSLREAETESVDSR